MWKKKLEKKLRYLDSLFKNSHNFARESSTENIGLFLMSGSCRFLYLVDINILKSQQTQHVVKNYPVHVAAMMSIMIVPRKTLIFTWHIFYDCFYLIGWFPALLDLIGTFTLQGMKPIHACESFKERVIICASRG